ncbi:hypothetical protein FBEOM_2076 [Fusarium beomiforme]|uniref:Uncharacterized protein n=1 Tax=Fusarium beomiforme TaxID=44412 RepID=A0A9P5ASL9_9HYPO|nr:hypothetical protein FBEOM_2076 [Fusarium beomiforme]
MLEWIPGFEQDNLIAEHGKKLNGLISAKPHAIKCLRELKNLTLGGQSDWVIDGILPYLSSNLSSLFLSQDCSMGSSSTPFVDLSQRCSHLRSLVLRQTLDTSNDLEQACKAWGETMEELMVSSIEDMRDWVSQVMPFMKVLRVLHLGPGCSLSSESIGAIASAESPLEEISLGDILPADGESMKASDETNQVLANMIVAHSSTLQLLELRCVDLGKNVLLSCKKARQLHTLDLSVQAMLEAPDIDDLLDLCTELAWFPLWFQLHSARRGEWEARIRTRDDAEKWTLTQEPTVSSLGT